MVVGPLEGTRPSGAGVASDLWPVSVCEASASSGARLKYTTRLDETRLPARLRGGSPSHTSIPTATLHRSARAAGTCTGVIRCLPAPGAGRPRSRHHRLAPRRPLCSVCRRPFLPMSSPGRPPVPLCVCALISSSYKDIGHVESNPHLVTSFSCNYLFKSLVSNI